MPLIANLKGSESTMHEAGIQVLERLLRLASNASVYSSCCRQLGLALSNRNLPNVVRFICTLAQQPGAQDAGLSEELLDELDDVFSRAQYWLLSCQPSFQAACAALHRSVCVPDELADLVDAIKAFTAYDRVRALREDVKQLGVAQDRASSSMSDGRMCAREAGRAGAHTGGTGADRGVGSAEVVLQAGGNGSAAVLNAPLRHPHESAASCNMWPARVPGLPTQLFQHLQELVPELIQQLVSWPQLAIAGMAGVGKTALALALFHAIKESFSADCCVFLTVGKHGNTHRLLQLAWKDLFGVHTEAPNLPTVQLAQVIAAKLHGKRVLLVLSDVWDVQALQVLNFARLKGHEAHQADNRVIVTVRNPALLTCQSAMQKWKVVSAPALTEDNARKLLCSHAFGANGHPEEYADVVQGLLVHAHGLPLVLQVLGAELRGQGLDVWRVRLAALAAADGVGGAMEQLREWLRPSVEALPPFTKRCFTVFAAFKQGERVWKEKLMTIFSGICPFQASDAWAGQQLGILLCKCLISSDSADGEAFFMHSALWDIARTEAERYPHTYDFNGPPPALEDGACTHRVDCFARLVIHPRAQWREVHCASSVRVLFAEHMESTNEGPTFKLRGDALHLCMRVLSLEWGSAIDALPEAVPCLLLLQRFHLQSSAAVQPVADAIQQAGSVQRPRQLGPCESLPGLPQSVILLGQLQHLDLGGCGFFSVLPDAIAELGQLRHLDLRACQSMTALPKSIGRLKHLQELLLGGCTSLFIVPHSIGQLAQLEHLYLDMCVSLVILPESIGQLKRLQRLYLLGCKSLVMLPESIGQLQQLQQLVLWGCELLTELPESIGQLQQLQELDLGVCESLTALPESINLLTQVQELDLSGCKSLATVPESIEKLGQVQQQSVTALKSWPVPSESVGLRVLDAAAERADVDPLDCPASAFHSDGPPSARSFAIL